MAFRICSKCILHSGIPGVEIKNSDGICSICENYDLNPMQEKRMSHYFTSRMERLIEEVKKQKFACEAIVLFSGGKDSTYLLNMLKEKYGLNVLALSVVHPLVNEKAVNNIEQVVNKMDVQFIKFRPQKKEYCKLIKYALTVAYQEYPDECIGCNMCSYIFKNIALIYAIRNNIPLVFDGTDKAQNETPIFIDGRKMKENARNGRGPFEPYQKIAIQALGENYKGSVYDFDYEMLKNYDFPSYISPLTFIDYKFQEDFEKFKDIGLNNKDFKTVITNCDAVPFFSYFSLIRYDCLTYVKHYANEIRKNSPYFVQSKLEYHQIEKSLPREVIQKLLNEYKNAVYYAVDHGLTPNNIANTDKNYLESISKTHQLIYGTEVCEIFLSQIAKINEYAKFFDIDLTKVGGIIDERV